MFKNINLDIRVFQMLIMAGLLSVGVYLYDFSLNINQVVLAFLAGLTAQYFWIKKFKLSVYSLFSAGITCFGLVLLLRSNTYWLHPLIAVIAVSSKFVLQKNKEHFFNPTAIGLVIALAIFPDAWLSPGQWGVGLSLAIWIIAIGSLLSFRAKQLNMAWYFLIFYIGGLALRNWYLGYEFEILLHSVKSGSLLLFTFFMITDPKTTPNHTISKLIFAFVVAGSSLIIQYYFFKNHGYIYSLVAANLLVPFLNKNFKSPKFQWRTYEKKSISYSY